MYVFLNDQWVKEEEAKISVFDKGFMSAESVYETLRTYQGRVFHLEAHYTRLERSALEMKIPVSFTVKELKEIIEEGIRRNAIRAEAYVRVQITDKTVFVWVRPMPAISPDIYANGVSVGFSPFRRRVIKKGDHTIKTTGALDIFLSRIHKPTELYDYILLNEQGFLTEGTFSNLFFISGGRLRTPALACGVLSGITREVVIQIAQKAGIQVEEGWYNAHELFAATEVFLSHTSASIVPVSRIEQFALPVGPLTRRLLNSFSGYIRTLA